MGNDDPGIACRMLKACESLYSIGLGGVESSPYYPGVGFKSKPEVHIAGDDGINACLIGHNGDGVVLAFRGTVLLQLDRHFCQSVRDWTNDFNIALAPAAGLPGKVPPGAAGAFAALWDRLKPVVLRLTADGTPLYITGHSKGALLAGYAAVRLLAEHNLRARGIYAFGSPPLGDAEFAARYDENISGHLRYEYCDDIVPFLARLLPCLAVRRWTGRRDGRWDYRHVGTLRYIGRDNRICGDSTELRKRRARGLLATLLVRNIVKAHLLPWGYLGGICREAPHPTSPHAPYGHTAPMAALRCVTHRVCSALGIVRRKQLGGRGLG